VDYGVHLVVSDLSVPGLLDEVPELIERGFTSLKVFTAVGDLALSGRPGYGEAQVQLRRAEIARTRAAGNRSSIDEAAGAACESRLGCCQPAARGAPHGVIRKLGRSWPSR
jgi:hypothetical protein